MPFLLTPMSRLSGLRFASRVLTVFVGAALGAQAASSINDGFDPNPNGIVNNIVVQPDGKILMGGYFTTLQPFNNPQSGHAYIARVNHDGSVDNAFTPNADGVVRALVLQSNGQILIGGDFTKVQGSGAGAFSGRSYAARLNADGSLDSVFNPGANGAVFAMAVQPNGQIIIGGEFTSVQPNGSSSPVPRNHVARFNVDGSLDTSFDPNTDKTVLSLAVQPNGQILIGGGFSSLQPNGAAIPATRSCIARVNSDGSLDNGFDPEANAAVSSIVVLPSGQILLGGQFLTFQPNGALGTTQVDFLARLNADGTVDTSFIVNPLAAVSAIAVQSDGRVLIGGTFTQLFPQNSTAAVQVAFTSRINTDGSLDPTYSPAPNQAVAAIAIQPDGQILLGGYFTSLVSASASAPTARNFIARVASDGSLDATMAPDAFGGIFASVQLPNGQYVVGGTFKSVGGATQPFLARINANGSLDASFAPVLNGSVATIALQSDGKLVVGGSFTTVDGDARYYLARINTDGSLDGPFNPNPNGPITLLALQSNGQIIVSGGFSEFLPNGATVGVGINALARLNTDGTVDQTYVPSPTGGSIFALAVQSDGKVIIGGEFASVDNQSRGYIARINTDGSLDKASFNPECDSAVYALAIQPDGKVLAGGSFNAVAPLTGVANTGNTTFIDAGGNTVTIPNAGQNVTAPIYINHLARFNTDGTLDSTFFPDPSATVLSIAVQSNGSILVAGAFTSFAQNGAVTGVTRNYIGRVSSSGALDAAFNPDANGQTNVVQLLSSGSIFVAGNFTSLQPNGAPAPIPANHMAVLNADGSIATSFSAGQGTAANGHVNTVALQPNGQLLVGGSFGPLAGSTGSYLMRVNPDGSSDASYLPDINGPVNAISVEPNGASTAAPSSYAVWLQTNGSVRYAFNAASNGVISAVLQLANGQVLLGGAFSNFAGISGFNNLVRLNTDGTVDTSFNPGPNGQVTALALESDGKVLVGGSFSAVGTTPFAYFVRLNGDGSLDSTFNPAPNGEVTCVAQQSDGKIVACGYFSAVETSATTTLTARSDIARFNTDGTLDTAFNPDLNGPPLAIVILSNQQILIGGSFTNITPSTTGTTVAINGLARLNTNGGLDTTFNPNPNSTVTSLAVQSNGQYLVGGNFTQFLPNPVINPTTGAQTGTTFTANYLARVNTDGSIDTTFNPYPNSSVTSIALQSNGQVVIGGSFSALNPNLASNTISRDFVARINSDGTVDQTFDPVLNSGVNVVDVLQDQSILVAGNFTTVQSGGAVLVGGAFGTVGGVAAPNLARLNADSTPDSTFTANPDGPVNAITSQAAGGYVIGGSFAHAGGLGYSNLFRLNAAGALDTTFNPGANGAVNAIAEQTNGSLLVGGTFTSIGGQAVQNLARLSASGTPDASFTPAVNGTVDAVVVQSNGQVVIGGAFSSVDGQAVANLARLNADGTLDAAFNPAPNGSVTAVTLQVDGSLYVAGAFTSIGGQALPYVAHLSSAGIVDSTFSAGPNAAVNAVAVQEDGKIVLGGAFTTVGGESRYELARLSAPGPVFESITMSADQSTISWVQSGGAPAFAAVKFEESVDGSHWTTVGQASPVSQTTWTLTGLTALSTQPYYVRATGVTPSSQFSSSGLVQIVQIVNIIAIPTITSSSSAIATSGHPFSFAVTTAYAATSFSASGLPAGLSINPSTGVISGTPTGSGTYTVSLTATSAAGSSVSSLTIAVGNSGTATFTPAATSSANRLLNLSSRNELTGSQVLIAGFVVSGSANKQILLRGVGPGLAAFNVPNTLATPELQLYNSAGALVSQNSSWGGGSTLAATFAQVGAFSLPANSADAAILTSLAPGSYTIHVFDPSGKGGVVLTEVYDASASPLTDADRLINISARGPVSSGAGALIGGFVVGGTSTKSVLIRGIGPGLAAFGVTDAIPDPVLTVYDSSGNVVAQNLIWTTQTSSGADQPSVVAQDIVNANASVGAFALNGQLSDTAVLVNLQPGAYTFQVTSASNTAGEALGEVYELP